MPLTSSGGEQRRMKSVILAFITKNDMWDVRMRIVVYIYLLFRVNLISCPSFKHPAALLFETSVHLYQMTRRHIPKKNYCKNCV